LGALKVHKVNTSANASEILAVTVAILSVGLFFASAILSVMFMIKHRGERWRTLPSISIITLPLIGLVPESGWSDGRSQWHESALILPWSVLMLCLVVFFFKGEKGAVSAFLRIAFGIMGIVGFLGSVLGLVEIWQFLHGF
jgi:hypothetical protein